MEFYSLLNSYGYAVYENKKSFEKKFPKNIFSSDEKISVEKIWHFFSKSPFSRFSGFSKKMWFFFDRNFFITRKNIFRETFFQKLFYFRKLHIHSYSISYRTLSNSSWSLRTSYLNTLDKKKTTFSQNIAISHRKKVSTQ